MCSVCFLPIRKGTISEVVECPFRGGVSRISRKIRLGVVVVKFEELVRNIDTVSKRIPIPIPAQVGVSVSRCFGQ